MNFFIEGLSVLFSQGMVVSPYEIIVEGSVGTLGGQTVTIGNSRVSIGRVVIDVEIGDCCQAR